MKYKFIAIEGNIGSGKTSLSIMLAEELNARLILEQFSNNPFLPSFYEDPDKYAFPLELSFLAERYQQLKDELSGQDLFQPVKVSDYYLIKSLIFAKNNLGEEEYNLYFKLFSIINTSLPKPDLIIYLYLETEVLKKNIKKRGRAYEQNISNEYLESIQSGYFNAFKLIKDIPIVIIDTGSLDFVSDKQDFNKIKAILNSTYSTGITRVLM